MAIQAPETRLPDVHRRKFLEQLRRGARQVPRRRARGRRRASPAFTMRPRRPSARFVRAAGIAPVPGDEALSTDAAWIGPRTATRLVYVQSGTHGVEGFCGSGIQTGWLQQRLHRRAAARYRAAADPRHQSLRLCLAAARDRGQCRSQSQLRRSRRGYPDNAGYEALKHAICPRNGRTRRSARRTGSLMGYAQRARPDGAAGRDQHRPVQSRAGRLTTAGAARPGRTARWPNCCAPMRAG